MNTPLHTFLHTLLQGTLLGWARRVTMHVSTYVPRFVLMGILVVSVWSAIPSSSAHAEGIGQCVDIESVFGLSLNERFRRVAQRLSSHPQRDALCAEIGLDCSEFPSTAHTAVEDVKCSSDLPELHQETCTLGGIDESSDDDLLETLAEELFENSHDAPMPLTVSACFDNPATCSALPPLDVTQFSLSTNPVPDTNDSFPFLRPQLGILPVLSHLDACGLAFATGVHFGIDRPPQHTHLV